MIVQLARVAGMITMVYTAKTNAWRILRIAGDYNLKSLRECIVLQIILRIIRTVKNLTGSRSSQICWWHTINDGLDERTEFRSKSFMWNPVNPRLSIQRVS